MNYLTLQSRVEGEINKTNLSTNIQTWINESRNEIAEGSCGVLTNPSHGVYRFTWSQTNLSTTISVALNDWPTNFIEEISLLYETDEKPLPKITPQYYDELLYSETDDQYALTDTGVPKAYINRGYQYEIVPAPGSTKYPIYLRYYAYPTALSGTTDEEEIDRQVPMLIILASALKAARYLHDMDLINLFQKQVEMYYISAVNKDKKLNWKNRTPRIRTYADYDMTHWKGKFQT